MLLSDVSIKRPVFATVIGFLLVAVGIVSFTRLALREYPDIDPPVVSIRTTYAGASANVVESRITEVIEDRIAGVEGIRYINSFSQDGQSIISIEFDISRNMDSAANDIRDAVGRVTAQLPTEADPPQIQKADADAHEFQPGPSDARAVAGAGIFLINGRGFDNWSTRLSRASGGNSHNSSVCGLRRGFSSTNSP